MKQSLWSYNIKSTFLFSILLFIVALLIFGLSTNIWKWPTENLEKTLLIGIFIISFLPVLLFILNAFMERGAVIGYKDIQLDFSKVNTQISIQNTIEISKNIIGVTEEKIDDSGKVKIMEELKKSTYKRVAVLDLEEGDAWWESRLFILLAGAVNRGQPEIILFNATKNENQGQFVGWADPKRLLPIFLKNNLQYAGIYQRAKAAIKNWELLEPPLPQTIPNANVLPTWLQSTANQYYWIVKNMETGSPNEYAFEELLTQIVGEEIEKKEEPKGINSFELEALFQKVLIKEALDMALQNQCQINVFLDSQNEFIVFTEKGAYRKILSKVSGLNAILQSLVSNTKIEK